jgi:hypothetical protein
MADALYGHKPQSAKPVSKYAGESKIVLCITAWSRIFEEFPIQIKECQLIGRKNSMQAVCRRRRRLEPFLYLAAQNFELFSKIKDRSKKIKKTLSFRCLSKDTTIMQI